MTKKNNASSARRKLIPAVGMLVVSAMMLSSSTYAWFSMSKDVSVNGMQIYASAEGGLLVTNEDPTPSWGTVSTATYHTAVPLLPTSTANASNWYYNTSDSYDDADVSQTSGYTELQSLTDPKGDPAVSDGAFGDGTYDYYLLNNFYLKSSGNAINTSSNNLKVLQVKATGVNGSANLDSSLRVAIVVNNELVKIYAPVTGADTSYRVNNATDVSTGDSSVLVDCSTGDGVVNNVAMSTGNIPEHSITGTTGAVNAKIYVYFEGEDEKCKSSNITATLDHLNVSVKFGLANPTSGMSTQSSVVESTEAQGGGNG